jgi:hypothetical protein
MEIIKQGFNINYSLNQMPIIKPGGHGVIESTGFQYKASLKIKCQNIVQIVDDVLGEIDKEELIEFKIPCDTDTQAIELNKLFRVLHTNGVVVQVNGSLPKYKDKSDYLEVLVLHTPQQLMQKYHDIMAKPPLKVKAQ